jgi:hypothetical protein
LDLDLEMLNEPSSGWAGKIALQNLLWPHQLSCRPAFRPGKLEQLTNQPSTFHILSRLSHSKKRNDGTHCRFHFSRSTSLLDDALLLHTALTVLLAFIHIAIVSNYFVSPQLFCLETSQV